MKFDVLIIGGGASGLCSAVLLKKNRPDLSVAILEAQNRVGKKLLVTGNGRCNITNKNLKFSSYHSENIGFYENAISKFGYDFTKEFFESLGIPFVEGDNGKMYPQSLQAGAVVDALRICVDELGIEVFYDCIANKIKKSDNGYTVFTENNEFICKKLILAVGGVAGGKSLVPKVTPYSLLTDLGHKIIKPGASLVQIKTDLDKIKALSGIKLDCVVTAVADGKNLRTEEGELLFTKYGISGPPVLQISRCFLNCKNPKVKINFMPGNNFSDVLDMLFKRRSLLKDRNAEFFFVGVFPKMLGHVLLKGSKVALQDKIGDISDKQIKCITENIVGFELFVTGNTGFDNAQVTAGGISTKDFSSVTMESLLYKGLYAIGEILDVDGDCGGFNLQWAWSSAAAAVEGILNDTSK